MINPIAMNTAEQFVITINRELGSGGRTVGEKLAARLGVLIQAPKESRIARVMEKQGLSRAEAEKAIDKVDKMRDNYVKHYADTSRYDARNYDLVINAEGKTEDAIAELILKYMQD